MTYKILFLSLIALIAAYVFIAALGASDNYQNASGSAYAVIVAAWFGWLVRDCDGD